MTTFTVDLDCADATRARCAYCGAGRGTARYFLTHGVVINLCVVHRSTEFVRRRRGHALVDHLRNVWLAHGMLTCRRRAALIAHLRRVAPAGSRRPGSYAWPALRREAEERFAAGEVPRAVIEDLRGRLRDAVAIVPSTRTMRRWFADGRWLSGRAQERRDPGGRRRRPPWDVAYPYGMRLDPIAPWGSLLFDLSRRSIREDDVSGGQ